MALTLAGAPFGEHPGGTFNKAMPDATGLIHSEDPPRRVRALLAGETIVDSRRVKLLHEHGHLPVYYFPEDDVRQDLLELTEHTTRCPYKGIASYWSVRVGDRVADNAVWSYRDPIEGAPPVGGYLAFEWDAMDRWLEEDEPVIVHARDPYHRVDVVDTSRHVRGSLAGQPLAETHSARVVFETSLPPRWYIPPAGRALRAARRKRHANRLRLQGHRLVLLDQVSG